jgi:hypothetical protein
LSRAATVTTGNGAPSHRVGSKGLLERGATEKTKAKKPNKPNLLGFSLRLPQARDTGLDRSRFGTCRKLRRRALNEADLISAHSMVAEAADARSTKLTASPHDLLTEADAASLHGLSASPGQPTINETRFASRRPEGGQSRTHKTKQSYVLTLALTREQKWRGAPLLRVGVERVVMYQC